MRVAVPGIFRAGHAGWMGVFRRTTPQNRDGRLKLANGTVGEVVRLCAKLGIIGFGGPASHIAMLEDEAVTRRKMAEPGALSRPGRRYQSDPRPQFDRNDDPYRLSPRRLAGSARRRHILCPAGRAAVHADSLDLCQIRHVARRAAIPDGRKTRPFWQSSSAPCGGWE